MESSFPFTLLKQFVEGSDYYVSMITTDLLEHPIKFTERYALSVSHPLFVSVCLSVFLSPSLSLFLCLCLSLLVCLSLNVFSRIFQI